MTDLWYIQRYLEIVADVMMQPALQSLDMVLRRYPSFVLPTNNFLKKDFGGLSTNRS